MVASVILNIPKFLEARLEEVVDLHNLTFLPIILKQTILLISLFFFFGQMENGPSEKNLTEQTVIYNVTELRVDSNYVYYYIHWTRWAIIWFHY